MGLILTAYSQNELNEIVEEQKTYNASDLAVYCELEDTAPELDLTGFKTVCFSGRFHRTTFEIYAPQTHVVFTGDLQLTVIRRSTFRNLKFFQASLIASTVSNSTLSHLLFEKAYVKDSSLRHLGVDTLATTNSSFRDLLMNDFHSYELHNLYPLNMLDLRGYLPLAVKAWGIWHVASGQTWLTWEAAKKLWKDSSKPYAYRYLKAMAEFEELGMPDKHPSFTRI